MPQGSQILFNSNTKLHITPILPANIIVYVLVNVFWGTQREEARRGGEAVISSKNSIFRLVQDRFYVIIKPSAWKGHQRAVNCSKRTKVQDAEWHGPMGRESTVMKNSSYL